MGFFGLGKKDKVLDLTERYRKQPDKSKKIEESSESQELPSQNVLGFMNFSNEQPKPDISSGDDERKKKLAKRLMDLTNKIEDLSNQIYHLQQRVELLERKMK